MIQHRYWYICLLCPCQGIYTGRIYAFRLSVQTHLDSCTYVVPDLPVCEHLRNIIYVGILAMDEESGKREERSIGRTGRRNNKSIEYLGETFWNAFGNGEKAPIPTLFPAARALHNWLLQPMPALHHSIPGFEMSGREDIKKKCLKDLKGPIFMQSAK